jgi:polo-like kinase 1
MDIKIGDFGLATRISSLNEKRKTLCGTPNYIAPEILNKAGHSYEADIWSMGCIMYTLLVGNPPFETSTLKETYSRIKRNEFIIPQDRVGEAAANLIIKALQGKPQSRPNIRQVLEHDFFQRGYMPPRLPSSALSTTPLLTEEQMTFTATTDVWEKDLGPADEPDSDYFCPRPVIRKSLTPVRYYEHINLDTRIDYKVYNKLIVVIKP